MLRPTLPPATTSRAIKAAQNLLCKNVVVALDGGLDYLYAFYYYVKAHPHSFIFHTPSNALPTGRQQAILL